MTGIRVGVGIIVLMGMVIVTSARVPAFRSNADLWRSAVAVSPGLARPHLNYGMALRETDRDGAVFFLVRAAELAPREARGAEMRALVRDELRWMSAFGDPICSRPAVAPFC